MFTGQYALPGAFRSKKVGGGQRPMPLNDALLNSLGGPTSTSAVPSIPTKVNTKILALHYISYRAAFAADSAVFN
jgi:hypothetical protein